MFYFFTGAAGVIRCEVRNDERADGYELVIERPDGTIQVEWFSGTAALNERWGDIERGLLKQGWRGPACLDPSRVGPA